MNLDNTQKEFVAEICARIAHGKQYRRDGVTPYIRHVEAVVNGVRHLDTETIQVAWLHDVLEDTHVTFKLLEDLGFGQNVIESVCLLTHFGYVDYSQYVERIKPSSIARAVKIADMRANMADAPTQKQIEKYTKALAYLEN